MRDPYWYEHHQVGSGWMILMMIFMVALVAAVVALVVIISRRPHPGGPPHVLAPPPAVPPPVVQPPPAAPRQPATEGYDTAARMLAERFALGEIDEAEFKAKLAVLRGMSG